jgi:hypothetical protein
LASYLGLREIYSKEGKSEKYDDQATKIKIIITELFGEHVVDNLRKNIDAHNACQHRGESFNKEELRKSNPIDRAIELGSELMTMNQMSELGRFQQMVAKADFYISIENQIEVERNQSKAEGRANRISVKFLTIVKDKVIDAILDKGDKSGKYREEQKTSLKSRFSIGVQTANGYPSMITENFGRGILLMMPKKIYALGYKPSIIAERR